MSEINSVKRSRTGGVDSATSMQLQPLGPESTVLPWRARAILNIITDGIMHKQGRHGVCLCQDRATPDLQMAYDPNAHFPAISDTHIHSMHPVQGVASIRMCIRARTWTQTANSLAHTKIGS